MTIDTVDTLEVQKCPTCSIHWAAPADYIARRRNDGVSFFCPNGHSLSYRQTEADKLRQERDRLKQAVAERDDDLLVARHERDRARAQANGHKGVAAKLKKRVARGVCPCCTRTFGDLQRHMATKHPVYVGEAHLTEGGDGLPVS